jgi:hypothetical protein
MTDIYDSISFDCLVFHNVQHGVFQAAYYFPENYTMIVKTENKLENGTSKIYPNKYQVSLLHDRIPVIQNTVFKIKDQNFQTEIQVTILMKKIMLWIQYNLQAEIEVEDIKIENLSVDD